MRHGPPARTPELPCRAIAAAIRAPSWRCDDACMLSAFATELTLYYPLTEYGGGPTLPFPDFASPCSWTAVSGTHAPITAGHPGPTPSTGATSSHATMPATWTLIADSLNWAGSCCGYGNTKTHRKPLRRSPLLSPLVGLRRRRTPAPTIGLGVCQRHQMPEVAVLGQQTGS
jgi:hypothetical protein